MAARTLGDDLGPHLRLLRRFAWQSGSWRLQVADDDPDLPTLKDLYHRVVIGSAMYHKGEYVGRGSGQPTVYELHWETVGFLKGVAYMESLNQAHEDTQ